MTVTQALATLFPHDPPRFLARTPHGYHDAEQIRAELNGAGFADISVEAVDGSGILTGFGFPSPGYSPVVITSIVIPSFVARSLFFAPENAGT